MDQNQTTDSPRNNSLIDAATIQNPGQHCLFYLKTKKANFKKLAEMNASVALINGEPRFDKKKRVLCIKH